MIAIYARVSTDEQAKSGYSIEDQIDKCIEKAGTSNVIKYIDDGYTGEIINRPQLTKLREDVKDGLIEKIICYDPDRLARNLMIQLLLDDEFKKEGVKLEFVRGDYEDNPEGKMFFSMRGAISEFEKAKIKERTMGGRVRKARKGLVVKNNHLYGYEYDREKNTYVIKEDEAKVVKMIFDYYTDPNSPFKGINGIAHHLMELGIPTKTGRKTWHRQVVRQILMNEAYKGDYYQNKWDTEGDYVKKQAGEKIIYGRLRPREEWIHTKIPAIVSEEQFDYAQKLLEQGRRRFANMGKHDYLLSGLVRCGRCGATMTGRRRLSHGKDFYVYECRKNYAGAKTKGCGRMIGENKLNRIVWENLVELLNDSKKIEEFTHNNKEEKPNYLENELDQLEKEIEKTRKGRKRLFQLVSISEDDDIDLEEIKEQIRNLQSREKELQAKYEEIKEEIEAIEEEEPTESILKQAAEMYFAHGGKEIPKEEKRKIICSVVKEVLVIDGENIKIYLF